jgi:hypothetical protein
MATLNLTDWAVTAAKAKAGGRRNPSVLVLGCLADVLGAKPRDFFDRPELD